MGGSDDEGIGLTYSQRLSNLVPGQTPSWTLEAMQGQPRIEGVGVLLPDGTVFLCSGAEQGRTALPPCCCLSTHDLRHLPKQQGMCQREDAY